MTGGEMKKFLIPRHYIEEYASLLGKTYWELLDEIKHNIDKNKTEQFLKDLEKDTSKG